MATETTYKKYPVTIIIAILISAILHVVIGYFTMRSNILLLLGCWSALFLSYFFVLTNPRSKNHVNTILIAAIGLRLIYIAAMPQLSDDYFRFVWDGRLTAYGINPYSYLPSELIVLPSKPANLSYEIFAALNSPEYYSVYPPVMQYIFCIPALLFPTNLAGSVIVMRGIILLSEVGSLLLMKKLFYRWNIPTQHLFIYALNPLVIVELTGNLHFEAVMIFFVLLSVYFLETKKLLPAAVSFALSVCTKLVPLILLPIIFKRLGIKQSLSFISVVIMTGALLFIPFADKQLISNIFQSIELYYQHFEFNASIFYLIREVGFYFKGYDIIHTVGKILPVVFILFITLLFFRDKGKNIRSLFAVALWVLLVYYSLALVVHPWYISMLIAVSVFTTFRFTIVWSAIVGFTYITYQSIPYKENLFVVLIEYSLVFGFAIYELYSRQYAKPFLNQFRK